MIARLIASGPCDCAGGFADVRVDRQAFPYEVGMVPGLNHQETAILAGVLTGLATFLFLALPILCCLCPCLPCMCCFGASEDKKAIAAETLEKSHSRHLRDTGSVPEDEIDAKLQELQQSGWEGMDFRHSDLDAKMNGGIDNQVVLSGNHSLGRSAHMMSESSGMRESGNVEEYTEYETTREINFQAVASNLPEHEYIYERDLRQYTNL
ncbi:hypothetical protein KUTeg_010940 [Tegillarca granosa]|uniref:Uncharacterized protein n=1 Tax=Tegillarca granosa TaxID=220873 RepID=A0ABQ9F2F3_TEGGR|nr:hypothetical protein KUTeg_010940 [Tegillarca granosa]